MDMTGLFDKELTPEEEKEIEERVARQQAAEKKYGIKKFRTDKQNQADKNRRKAFAEHKLIFPSTTDKVNETTHKFAFGSIRSQTFQKLLFLDFMMRDSKSPLHLELVKIQRECEERRPHREGDWGAEDLVHYLKPEHVMKLIGVSERTAIEYIEVLHHFHSQIPYFASLQVARRKLEEQGMSYDGIYSGPSTLRERYPAIVEGEDSNKSPQPLPTWFYRFVMDKTGLEKEGEGGEEEKDDESY